MNYFLDQEFLEGTQAIRIGKYPIGKLQTKPTIDLISIGLINENSKEYYAVCKEFNLREAWERTQLNVRTGKKEYWLRDNVLQKIYEELYKIEPGFLIYSYSSLKYLINKYGKTKEEIKNEILQFIGEDTVPKFHGYFSDYDWVCFCWIFGKMIDLPNNFSYYCTDLKQMLDEKVIRYYNCTNKDLLNEKLYQIKNSINYPKNLDNHNALSDARWNLQLFQFIQNLI